MLPIGEKYSGEWTDSFLHVACCWYHNKGRVRFTNLNNEINVKWLPTKIFSVTRITSVIGSIIRSDLCNGKFFISESNQHWLCVKLKILTLWYLFIEFWRIAAFHFCNIHAYHHIDMDRLKMSLKIQHDLSETISIILYDSRISEKPQLNNVQCFHFHWDVLYVYYTIECIIIFFFCQKKPFD